MKSMLIIDDSITSRMMLKSIVSKEHSDWTICEAANSEEALAQVSQQSFDLVTVDYNMPGMDGLTLIPLLQKEMPNARIALLTANIQDYIQQGADDLGVPIIHKPITPAKVLAYVG
ncbi:MAG: response regulator [Immundisolibacteraceae bacterium]|nr:response regulator [Immundisolibacteraceae bacterium]